MDNDNKEINIPSLFDDKDFMDKLAEMESESGSAEPETKDDSADQVPSEASAPPAPSQPVGDKENCNNENITDASEPAQSVAALQDTAEYQNVQQLIQAKEILERCSNVLESQSVLYQQSAQNLAEQGDKISKALDSLSETEGKAREFCDKIGTLTEMYNHKFDALTTLYAEKFKAVSAFYEENVKLIKESGGIDEPSEKGFLGAFGYFIYRRPAYKIKLYFMQPWFKMFALLISVTLLLLSLAQNCVQSHRLREAQQKQAELMQYEKKYWAVKSLSAPGSKLENYCDRLDVYFADPEYYKQQIDSLTRILTDKAGKERH